MTPRERILRALDDREAVAREELHRSVTTGHLAAMLGEDWRVTAIRLEVLEREGEVRMVLRAANSTNDRYRRATEAERVQRDAFQVLASHPWSGSSIEEAA